MVFSVTVPDLINIIFIAAGMGICGLNLFVVSSPREMGQKVRRYFQVFFCLILVYITTHLARQMMEGLAGAGIHAALQAVTSAEMIAAGLMAFTMSRLVLHFAYGQQRNIRLERMLWGLLGLHVLILLADLLVHFVFFFDAENLYHRAPLYFLSNLCPLVMLVVNLALLLRRRDRFSDGVFSAFLVYLIAPLLAIAVQSFTYGIQFIIIATVGSAAYVSLVVIREQSEQYRRQKEEASRLETELELAARIQANMLPNIFPAFPDRSEFDIYASMMPAKEVGGDFYDFYFVDDEHLALAIADVSGKGIPAALFMMISKILVQNIALTGRGPAEVLEAVNDQICANNPEDMFVTVWLGILDVTDGTLVAANAGHEYPVIRRHDGEFELYKDPHGLVVGGMEGVPYRQYELRLEPGDELFVYTDGVPEATDAAHELFGTDRMVAALRSAGDGDPQEVLSCVRRSVADFVAGEPQFDDLTMLCIRYTGRR